ncbi:MAG: polysaccharide biosynthesis/export family protein [Pyrinomonadaceae bacterium]
MKAIVFLKGISMVVCALPLTCAIAVGQTDAPKLKDGKKSSKNADAAKAAPIPAPTPPTDDPPSDGTAEENAIIPYYENYLKEYRLGPTDQISIEVFGQCPDYCKTGITIPPNATISYPLIREGILVAGKTVEQVANEIKKKLDEFIIDPQVTVTLDKAMATRYSVMGNVAVPGVRVMDRRVSVYEAILDAGGVTKNGDKKKVALVSYGKDGRLSRRVVNLAEMEAGKADMIYLSPGDQVFVTGKGFSLAKAFDILTRASAIRYIAGSPL